MNTIYTKSTLILAIFMVCLSMRAQTSLNLDSLLRVNENYKKEDTTKLKMLIQIAEQQIFNSSDKGLVFAEKAVELAEKLRFPLFLGQAYFLKGRILGFARNYKEALAWQEKGVAIFEKLGHQLEMAKAYYRMGIIYFRLNDLVKSKEFSEKALKIYEKLGDKTNQAASLYMIGEVYLAMGDGKNPFPVFEKLQKLYEQLKDTSGLGMNYIHIGMAFEHINEYGKSLEYYKKATDIATSVKSADYLFPIAFNLLAIVSAKMGDYPKALDYLHKSLNRNEKDGNKYEVCVNLANIGEIYKDISDYPKALEYYHKALAGNVEVKDKSLDGGILGNIGEVYIQMNNYPKALDYIQQALSINEKIPAKIDMSFNYQYLGDISMKTSQYEKAIEYYQKSIALAEENGFKMNIAKSLLSIGRGYHNVSNDVLSKLGISPNERFTKALELQQKALKMSQELGDLPNAKLAWQNLSETYEKMNDYIKSYDAYKNYISIRDSIEGEAVKKQITRKEIQYEFDKKEAVLKFEQQLTTEQLEKQKLLSVQQQQALSLKEQALIISNKEKDLQHLAFLKEKAEKQEREQELSLAEKDKQLQSSQLSSLIQEKAYQVQALAKKNALIGFLVSSLVAVILGLIAFLLWFRQKQAKREAGIQVLFSQQLIKNIEEERRRIAFDLHDSISHELLTLKRSIHKDIEPSKVSSKIDDIIDDIRKISRNLHPVLLEKIGLKLSIDTLCEQYGEHENLFVSHEIEYNKQLPCTSELQVFRIIQEVLTNTAKYAHANASYIGLKQIHNALKLEIRDNGKGFDVEKTLNGSKAFGLHSILQRSKVIGGNARIDSSNLGTTIQIVIPI